MQELLTSLEDRVRPEHTAVIVVDIQNDFCAEEGYIARHHGCDAAANEALADTNVRLTDVARAAGSLIVWVQAIYDPEYLSAPMLVRNGTANDTVRCAEGSWGADFYRVAPQEGDLVMQKHRYSAFSGTPLDNLLRRRGIRTAVVTGVATNICVESTLREGFNLGYYIVVPDDCVGSGNQALHEATLQNVSFLLGDVVGSNELIALWQGEQTDRA